MRRSTLIFRGTALSALLAGAAGLAAAGATANLPVTGTTDAWRAEAVRQLAAMTDTDAQATAAALVQLSDGKSGRAMHLIDHAAAMAPAGKDIASLDMAICRMQPGCDVQQRAARMRRIDPTNGATWMDALHDAAVHRDAKRTEAILAQMAHAKSFNIYFIAIGRRFAHALARIRPPVNDGNSMRSGQQRQAMALSLAGAMALPALQDLVLLCEESPTRHANRRGDCRSIAGSMEDGDSIITNLIGVRLRESSARDANDQADAVASWRRLQWRMTQLRRISGTPRLSTARQAAIMMAHVNERDGIDAMLAEAHEPLDPPAAWMPPQAKPVPLSAL